MNQDELYYNFERFEGATMMLLGDGDSVKTLPSEENEATTESLETICIVCMKKGEPYEIK